MNFYDGCVRCGKRKSPLFTFNGQDYICDSCFTPSETHRYNELRNKSFRSKESLKIYAMRSGMSESEFERQYSKTLDSHMGESS